MSYFERVDETTLAAWNQLAARLREDLAAAGFTLFDQASTTGVEVEVDPGNDPAGGIFVRWSVSPTLMERIHPAVVRGDHDDPALHHFGVIQKAMEEALRESWFQPATVSSLPTMAIAPTLYG